MTLDPSKLETNLKDLLTTKSDTAGEAAQAWVNAYADYAADATGLGFSPTITDLSKSTMKGSLETYFESGTIPGAGTPPAAASAIASALSVFWLVPPVVFVVPPPLPAVVAVSSVTGTAPLIVALTTAFSPPFGSEDSKASEISSAIDAFTKLVQVTNVTPPGATGFLL